MSLFTSFMLLLLLLVNYTPPTSHSKLGSFYCYDIIGVAMAAFLSIMVANISYTKSKMSVWLLQIVRKSEVILCIRTPKSQTNTGTPENTNGNKDWLRLASWLQNRSTLCVHTSMLSMIISDNNIDIETLNRDLTPTIQVVSGLDLTDFYVL
ncbi:hypothetical protein CAPTEDRAFT_205451, partial [Capitella teleta]